MGGAITKDIKLYAKWAAAKTGIRFTGIALKTKPASDISWDYNGIDDRFEPYVFPDIWTNEKGIDGMTYIVAPDVDAHDSVSAMLDLEFGLGYGDEFANLSRAFREQIAATTGKALDRILLVGADINGETIRDERVSSCSAYMASPTNNWADIDMSTITDITVYFVPAERP